MIDFRVNQQICTGCGQCAADCPARIIRLTDGFPGIAPEREPFCYRCQHCLAICPPGAISILGRQPEKSLPLPGHYPEWAQLQLLIQGRRSIRRYREENLDPELLQRLLEVAWYAPTGVNSRQVQFNLVDDGRKMAAFRDEVMTGLGRLVRTGALPERLAFFADFVRLWEEKGVDTVFRGAPHLLVVSAPQEVVTPLADCLIALTTFDLLAQANGVGTVWDGLARITIDELLPETRLRLGIPENHLLGGAMVFGRPAVHYARTVQHGPVLINRFSG